MKRKKKLCFLPACLACISMLAWKPLPAEADAWPHTIFKVYWIPIPTEVVFSYNGSTHAIEYGARHTLASCRYRFFKDIYSHPERICPWNNLPSKKLFPFYSCCFCPFFSPPAASNRRKTLLPGRESKAGRKICRLSQTGRNTMIYLSLQTAHIQHHPYQIPSIRRNPICQRMELWRKYFWYPPADGRKCLFDTGEFRHSEKNASWAGCRYWRNHWVPGNCSCQDRLGKPAPGRSRQLPRPL